MRRVRSRRSIGDKITSPRGTRARLALGATIIAALAGLSFAQAVHAGTYVMRNCDVPGQSNAELGPWGTSEMAPNAVLVNACSSGGGVGFAFTGGQLAPGVGAVLALRRPPTGPQSQITLVKAVLWYAARLAGSGAPLYFSSLVFVNSPGSYHFGVTNGPPGAENLVLEQVFTPQEDLYKVYVLCGPPSGPLPAEDCLPASATPLQIRGMEITLSEDAQPIVQPPGGTLLSAGPQSGMRTVSFAAADSQSGLAKVEVLLDDTVVATRDLTALCINSDFTVCPASDAGSLDVDTRAVANGVHRLALRVRDAAANERLVAASTTIEIRNPTTAQGTSPLPSIAASFSGSSRSSLTVPYGRRVRIDGRLSGGMLVSLGGASLEVFERIARRGAQRVSVGRVRTRPDGSFAFSLQPHRPSRTVQLEYRASGVSPTVSHTLKLRVRAATRLRARLDGLVIGFRGQVLSRPIPRRGKIVRLEGKAPGSAWTAFANVRTDSRGQFSGHYRLRIRRPGVKLKIRAVVPEQRGYPYALHRTQPVTLRVH